MGASTAESIAALRAYLHQRGIETAEMTDAEVALAEVDDLVRENTALRDRYQALLCDRVRFEQDARAAARREFHDDTAAWARAVRHAQTHDAHSHITTLLHWVRQLPDRPTPTQVDTVRSVAQTAAHALAQPARSQDLALAEHWRTEVQRLRDLITEAGEDLADHPNRPPGPRDANGHCHCLGCDLIRAMDDLPSDTELHSVTAVSTALSAA